MIRFILLQNRQGKTRLAKYYIPLEESEKHKLEYEKGAIVNQDPYVIVALVPIPANNPCIDWWLTEIPSSRILSSVSTMAVGYVTLGNPWQVLRCNHQSNLVFFLKDISSSTGPGKLIVCRVLQKACCPPFVGKRAEGELWKKFGRTLLGANVLGSNTL
eukprot:Gb_01357 [translate_table: standard]